VDFNGFNGIYMDWLGLMSWGFHTLYIVILWDFTNYNCRSCSFYAVVMGFIVQFNSLGLEAMKHSDFAGMFMGR
jgi:hypothetical protein